MSCTAIGLWYSTGQYLFSAKIFLVQRSPTVHEFVFLILMLDVWIGEAFLGHIHTTRCLQV